MLRGINFSEMPPHSFSAGLQVVSGSGKLYSFCSIFTDPESGDSRHSDKDNPMSRCCQSRDRQELRCQTLN